MFELAKNANVTVIPGFNDRGQHNVEIIVDDQYHHVFPHASTIAELARLGQVEEITRRLNGGHFFFGNGMLLDFRYSDYHGFIHTNDSVKQLMDLLGVTAGRIGNRRAWGGSNLTMGKKWNASEFEISGFGSGGAFKTELSFVWSPFVATVNTVLSIIRLICSNGMTTTSDFMNAKIPLVNRWEEHLGIAQAQLHNKASAILQRRIGHMVQERATISDLLGIATHAHKRLIENRVNLDGNQRERLQSLFTAVNPVYHLRNHYSDDVFRSSAVASRMPGHLSLFDAYNVVTELNTHFDATESSTAFALDKISNAYLFDRSENDSRIITANNVHISSFADPERAFYGDVDEYAYDEYECELESEY